MITAVGLWFMLCRSLLRVGLEHSCDVLLSRNCWTPEHRSVLQAQSSLMNERQVFVFTLTYFCLSHTAPHQIWMCRGFIQKEILLWNKSNDELTLPEEPLATPDCWGPTSSETKDSFLSFTWCDDNYIPVILATSFSKQHPHFPQQPTT